MSAAGVQRIVGSMSDYIAVVEGLYMYSQSYYLQIEGCAK